MDIVTPRFLVINVSRIGDTLLMTPAVRAIAVAYHGCEITLLAHPKRVEILRNLPFVSSVGAIEKHRAPFLGRLGAKRYDYALVYGHDVALIEYALRVAHKVVAFRQSDASLNARLHRVVEVPPLQTMHAVRIQLLLPAALAIAPAGLRLAYQVTPGENSWARTLLHERLPSQATPLIGLQIASFPTKAYRDWPLENFIALCERIRQRYPEAVFLIFGGKLETQRTAALYERFRERTLLFAGKLTLRQTAALMNQVDLYVGVDTGPTHIMGALGRPMVALYHGYSPSNVLAPLEHPALYVVDHPRAGKNCSPEVSMAEIDVDRVWDKVITALSEHPPSGKLRAEGGS